MEESKKNPGIVKNLTVSTSKLNSLLNRILSPVKKFFAATHKFIGFDIGYGYVKIVQISKMGGGYAIAHLTHPLPEHAKEDPEEKKRIAQEVIQEFIENNHIKTSYGRLVISGKGIYIFSIDIPASISKKDLKGAVGLELKKRLPSHIDMSRVNFDFFVTNPPLANKKLANMRVTCVAVESGILEENVQLLKEIGIKLTTININADALGNLLAACSKDLPLDKTVALLDLGSNATSVNFYRHGELCFSREIPIGGDHITKAMVRTIVSSVGTVNIGFEDAEKIKLQCGITLSDDDKTEFVTPIGVLVGSQISAMLRPTLERLVSELTRTINYYLKTYNAEDTLGLLYITGGTSRLKNMDRFFESSLTGIVKRVERLNPLKAIRGWLDIGILRQELVIEQAAPHLSAAIGACVHSGGKVNLLPFNEKLEQKAKSVFSLIKVSFPMILAFNLTFYAFNFLSAFRYKVLISKTESDIERMGPTVNKIKDYLVLKTKMSERKSLLDKAVGRQPLWWGVLKELSNITPEGVVLHKLTTTQKEPREIHLIGEIFSKYTTVDLALSQYLLALDESPFFVRVDLVSSQTDMYSPTSRAVFDITCVLRY